MVRRCSSSLISVKLVIILLEDIQITIRESKSKNLERMNLACICIVEQIQKDLNLKETLLIQMILLVMDEIIEGYYEC